MPVKIRIHGSGCLDNINFGTEYKIDKSRINLSVFSMFSDKPDYRVPDRKYLKGLNSLIADISKSIEKEIAENPTDFLILELSNTVYMKLAYIDGLYYTKTQAFTKSSFAKDFSEKSTFIDIAENSEDLWKSLFQKYIDTILKYYSPKQIILVKTPYPEYYAGKNFLVKWREVSSRRMVLNTLLKNMYKFFTDRVDCFVIDSAEHYFADGTDISRLFMTRYEKECFSDIKECIDKITAGKLKPSVINNYSFSKHLKRYIRFYDSIKFSGLEQLFFDEDSVTGKIICEFPVKELNKFQDELRKLDKLKPSSFDDILNSDMFVNSEFIETVKLIKAVYKGELSRRDINYDIAFEKNLKAVSKIADSLNDYFRNEKIIEKDFVNTENAGYYLKFMQADEKQKIQLLLTDADYLPKKELRLFTKKNKKNLISDYEYKAILNRKISAGSKIKADIWGSEILKNIVQHTSGKFEINNQFYGNSVIFAFDDRMKHTINVLCDRQPDKNSTLFHELNKDIPDILRENHGEWLILDLYSLVGECAEFFDGRIAVSEEMFDKPPFLNDRQYKLFRCKVFSRDEMILKFNRFINFVSEIYGKNIILVHTDIKTHYLNENMTLEPIVSKNGNSLLHDKQFLNGRQKEFIKATDCICIDNSNYFLADSNNIKGISPVSYRQDFYEFTAQLTEEIILSGNPDKRRYSNVTLEYVVGEMLKLHKNGSFSKGILKDNMCYPKI